MKYFSSSQVFHMYRFLLLKSYRCGTLCSTLRRLKSGEWTRLRFFFVFYTHRSLFKGRNFQFFKLISGSPSGQSPVTVHIVGLWTVHGLKGGLALAEGSDLTAVIATVGIGIVKCKVTSEVVFATSSVASFATRDAKSTIIITMLSNWSQNIQSVDEFTIAFAIGTFNSTIHII